VWPLTRTAVPANRLAAGRLPAVRRNANVAPDGADHPSATRVLDIAVVCSADADAALANVTVIRTDRPAVTVTVPPRVLSYSTPFEMVA
jgi:hypothetical protein